MIYKWSSEVILYSDVLIFQMLSLRWMVYQSCVSLAATLQPGSAHLSPQHPITFPLCHPAPCSPHPWCHRGLKITEGTQRPHSASHGDDRKFVFKDLLYTNRIIYLIWFYLYPYYTSVYSLESSFSISNSSYYYVDKQGVNIEVDKIWEGMKQINGNVLQSFYA